MTAGEILGRINKSFSPVIPHARGLISWYMAFRPPFKYVLGS